MYRRMCWKSIFGICSLQTPCWETLTGTMEIGASCSMKLRGKQALRRFTTAEAVCCPRLTNGEKALQVVRFRSGYANADLGRIDTQQDFLMAAEYEGCNEAVKRIVPRVDMGAVDAFIGTAPYLSDLQRAFYKHYIRARYELILAPAFDLVTGLEQEPGQPTMGL